MHSSGQNHRWWKHNTLHKQSSVSKGWGTNTLRPRHDKMMMHHICVSHTHTHMLLGVSHMHPVQSWDCSNHSCSWMTSTDWTVQRKGQHPVSVAKLCAQASAQRQSHWADNQSERKSPSSIHTGTQTHSHMHSEQCSQFWLIYTCIALSQLGRRRGWDHR